MSQKKEPPAEKAGKTEKKSKRPKRRGSVTRAPDPEARARQDQVYQDLYAGQGPRGRGPRESTRDSEVLERATRVIRQRTYDERLAAETERCLAELRALPGVYVEGPEGKLVRLKPMELEAEAARRAVKTLWKMGVRPT